MQFLFFEMLSVFTEMLLEVSGYSLKIMCNILYIYVYVPFS